MFGRTRLVGPPAYELLAPSVSAPENAQPLTAAEARERVFGWLADARNVRELTQLHAEMTLHDPRSEDEARLRRHLEDWLITAIETGELRAFEVRRAKRIREKLPDIVAALQGVIEEKKGWFEVIVVDAWGKAVADVDLAFSYQGEKKKATTAGSGKVRIPDVTASFGDVRFADMKAVRESVKSRWQNAVQPKDVPAGLQNPERVGLDATEVRVSIESERTRTIVLTKPLRRVRLIGMHFDTSKAFLLPTAMEGIRRVVGIYKRLAGGKLLILGHTDTSGDDAYNLDLSVERAESVKAYLKNDVASWEAWFGSDKPAQKRWADREVLGMISALPCDPTVKGFQQWSNDTRGTSLDIDGIAGPKTRKEVITAYMKLEDTTLPDSIDTVIHGCGEFFPRKDEGDNFGQDGTDAAEDRRVEMICFDDDVIPPAPGKKASKGEAQYEQWTNQVTDTIDLEAEPRGSKTLRLTDFDRNPLAKAQCRVVGQNDTVFTADDLGDVTINYRLGDKELELEWRKDPDAASSDDSSSSSSDSSDSDSTNDGYIFKQKVELSVFDESDEQCERRLRNLGFDGDEVPDLVSDYQRFFGKTLTRELDDIREELVKWHDGGARPPQQPPPAGAGV